MKKILITIILSCYFTTLAYAGSCDAISCTGKLKNLYPNGLTGKIYIEVNAPMSALQCTLEQGKFIVLKDNNLLHAEIYSMLLATAISKQDVRIRIYQDSPDCELQYTMLQL